MDQPERPVTAAITSSRNVVVAALLGGGSGVMAYELGRENLVALAGAVAVGALMLALLPRPLDLRSAIYAFFVPISMTYGAVTAYPAILIIGTIAGVFFLLEKTVGQRRRL